MKRIEENEFKEEKQEHREKVDSFQLQIDEILNREESLTAEDIEFIKKRKQQDKILKQKQKLRREIKAE